VVVAPGRDREQCSHGWEGVSASSNADRRPGEGGGSKGAARPLARPCSLLEELENGQESKGGRTKMWRQPAVM